MSAYHHVFDTEGYRWTFEDRQETGPSWVRSGTGEDDMKCTAGVLGIAISTGASLCAMGAQAGASTGSPHGAIIGAIGGAFAGAVGGALGGYASFCGGGGNSSGLSSGSGGGGVNNNTTIIINLN